MMKENLACAECGSVSLQQVTTYKRYWRLCRECGCGTPVQRQRYPFAFLPGRGYKKLAAQDEQSIYDYFVDPDHIQYSIETAHEFVARYIDGKGIDLRGKRVLDVSGGNGYFIKEIEKCGAKVALTEINKKSIALAREKHNIDVYEFNFNRHRLNEVVTQKFDVLLLRAAIMFCDDLGALGQDLARMVDPGGLIIINHSVLPTLGVLLRTQLDEFSYSTLRQPETVISHMERAGLELISRDDETDPSLYVYDHDLLNSWLFVWMFYEYFGAKALRGLRKFSFPARDRRRSTMIFRRK